MNHKKELLRSLWIDQYLQGKSFWFNRHLDDLSHVQQSDSLHTGRSIRRILTFEVWPDVVLGSC